MVIQLADSEDLDDLADLIGGFRDFLERRHPEDEEIRRSLYRMLGSNEADFFVAVDGTSKAVGFIQQRYRYSLWIDGLEATLEDLFVSPEGRRQGVGTKLVQFAIDQARAKECKAIRLDTNESNHPAMELYDKFGFSAGADEFGGSRQLLLTKFL